MRRVFHVHAAGQLGLKHDSVVLEGLHCLAASSGRAQRGNENMGLLEVGGDIHIAYGDESVFKL